MKLVTSTMLFDKLAENWKASYFIHNKWNNVLLQLKKEYINSEEVYNKLLTLKTPKEVIEYMGTDDWLTFKCNGCNKKVDTAILISSVFICKDCLLTCTNIIKK